MSDTTGLVTRWVLQATAGVIAIASTSGTAAAQQTVSNSAKYLGVAAAVAMLVLLGLAYFFIKYGGDYVTPTGE